MIRILQDGTPVYPYSLQQLREDFPNTSFPVGDYSSVDVFVIGQGTIPTYDPATQGVREIAPDQDVDGKWIRQYEVYALPAEDVLANQQAAEQQLIQTITAEAQLHLDTFAATRSYDGVNSSTKYKDFTDEEIAALPAEEQPLVSKFRTESQYLAMVTARTWAKFYLILDEVKAGTRPVPSSFADVESDLPVLAWPNN